MPSGRDEERSHRVRPGYRIEAEATARPWLTKRSRWTSSGSQGSRFARGEDWVFATALGTPCGHRNVSRRALGRTAQLAELNDDGWPPLRFHDLRHTFASHLIIDLGLDPAQVSRMLGHARITITLDIYTHLFAPATHATSAPAWPPAHSPACSSPPQPPPARQCSNSDDGRNAYRSNGRCAPFARWRPVSSF